MPKSNFLFFLNGYNDLSQTTTPALSNFKWSREINGVPYNEANSQQIQVAANSTSPNIVPYPFSTPVNSGTNSLNSTDVMTILGPVAGISVGNVIVGTGMQVGTFVDAISPNTVFTVTAANATAGAVYSNNGQQFTITSTIVAGTTLSATQTGDSAASGTLTKVSGTGDATISFSARVRPTVTMSQPAGTSGSVGISFYSAASFIYMESDQQVTVIYNNVTPVALVPFEINGITMPGVFFLNGPAYNLTVTNPGSIVANVFFAAMG